MYVQRFGTEKKNYFDKHYINFRSCARHETVHKIMKIYQISDTSRFTSDGLFKTIKEAKQYIKELIAEDVKEGYTVWDNDFIIWELDTAWMMRRRIETIDIKELKNTIE